ncbi:hypothetical protein JJT62_13510 [Methylocystis sp. Sn-Cys]|nr:hypothetical protein [Methylocystis sp. Sn-Cys]
MALGARGDFITCEPSSHMRTNIAVIRAFLGERIALTELGMTSGWRRFDRARKHRSVSRQRTN